MNNAYGILMDFLQSVKYVEHNHRRNGQRFAEIRLSIVDTSEEDFIPASGREGYPPGKFPVPDFNKCRRIAQDFGWPLIIKRLFRDSCDNKWSDPSIQKMCARGIPLDMCRDCSYRH